MKKFVVLSLMLICSFVMGKAEEITLFDRNGTPTAYIDTADEDLTIYMWNGLPVAYLSTSSRDAFHIYGFNGRHLGWFEDGIVRNHDGEIVGFQKGAVSKYTEYEPYKAYKKYKPYKAYKEYAPQKPYYTSGFGRESLSLFLMRGKG